MREIDHLLIQACSDQDYQKISELLDAGADPNAVDEEGGESPLTALVYNVYASVQFDEQQNMFFHGDFCKAIELLLQKGADINLVIKAKDGCISTALLESQYTMPEVAQFLLEHGADPDIVNEEQETILDAIEVCLFVDYDGRDKKSSDYWVTESRIRKILLDHGAHRAWTLTQMAEFKNWDEVKQKIYHACWYLEASDLDKIFTENPIVLPDERFSRLFYEAVKTAPEFMQKHFIDDPDGYEDRLIALLDVFRKHGFDFNADKGDALYFSVWGGYVKTTCYLLAHGADPGKCDCGCWYDSADQSPEHRHDYTLPEKVLEWCGRWKEETALAFQKMFPSAEQ